MPPILDALDVAEEVICARLPDTLEVRRALKAIRDCRKAVLQMALDRAMTEVREASA